MFAKPLRGLHVFWMVFAFFAVVVAVDAGFIVSAVRSFPGEEVQNSYVLGLDYNKEVARKAAQRELGWRAEAGIRNEDGPTLVVRFSSADGAPLTGLIVNAEMHVLGRANDSAELALHERSRGEYSASLPFREAGRLEVVMSANRHGDPEPIFQASKTLAIS